MKASGKRLKGKRLELAFSKLLRKIDKKAKRMPLSGADWAFRGDIYTQLPFHFECKNQEKIRIWEWWEQCEADCHMKTPVLVYTSNNRPIMITMRADDFIAILEEGETK